MPSPTVQFRSAETDPLRLWLTQRAQVTHAAGIGGAAKAELHVWMDVLRRELAAETWTLPELALIAAAHTGTVASCVLRDGPASLLAADIYDLVAGREAEHAEHFGIDPAPVMARLHTLSPVREYALTAAVSAWCAQADPEHSPAGWAKVGIQVTEVEE